MADLRPLLVLALLLAGGALVYLLAPVLTPFLIAVLLAYLGDPLVDWLEARRLSRTGAVCLVFVVLLVVLMVLLVLLLPALERQIVRAVAQAPRVVEAVSGWVLPWLQTYLGVEPGAFDLQALRQELTPHLGKAGGVLGQLIGTVTASSVAIFGWLANLLLIPVVTFYLLRDWDLLVARVHALLPRRAESTISALVRESDAVLGAFMRGQLLVMLALATVYALGLALLGLDFALLIGALAGLLSFVPYLGLIVGIATAGIAAAVQFQDVLHVLGVVAVFGLAQALEGMVLTPRLVGDRIGLHPVAVIFAVMVGAQLFGFFGILLALPVTAVLAVLARHAHERYLVSEWYRP